jgi:glycosyltransferase involved in cell wall biosynthesis
MNESVSILIPTRNRSAILAKCVAALPEGIRGINPPEVIVVDDCSSDATPEIVEAFRRSSGWQVRCLRQEKPLGANAARNAALDAASGEIIVFIDDDAIATEGWLLALLGGLTPEMPVVTGAIRLNLEGPLVGRHRAEVSTYLSEVLTEPRGESGEIVPVACNMAAYRWVFDRARFDGSIRPPCEEGDWLRRADVDSRFVPEALVLHYKTPDDARLERVLLCAWLRGSEGGWWVRERLQMPARERRALALRSLKSAARSFGHAAWRRCWGGVVVGFGELSRALALTGVINRRARVPESWR